MDSKTTACYLCEKNFDVDELQTFQPGFRLEWKPNLDRCTITSSNGKHGAQNDLHVPENRENEILIRAPQNRLRKKKYGDGHACEYDRYAADGKCIHCQEEHDFCNLLNSESRCSVCYRAAVECSADESKSFFLVNRLLQLCTSHPRTLPTKSVCGYSGVRPLKIIVFSQFREALNFVGDRLLKRFGTACVAEYFGRHRKEELRKFNDETQCFCLLLTRDGAEGLDLSFVTNIIFLEEIYDRSLQDQAVARAWRMGAKGVCQVETLVASNSVEEAMSNQKLVGGCSTERTAQGDQQRLKTLLQSLKLITDFHNFASTLATKDNLPDKDSDTKYKRKIATATIAKPHHRKKQKVGFKI
jgi:SNF2 family DNA or RNA helicase